jgi:hypothetical protein
MHLLLAYRHFPLLGALRRRYRQRMGCTMPPEQALWEQPAGTGLFQAVGARGPAPYGRNALRVCAEDRLDL